MILPALNLIAAPGRRLATLDLAREIERRGFAGIQVSSQYANMAQCIGLAFATRTVPIATAIAPIYAQTVDEFAQAAAYLHEVSGGRFRFGIGVAHAPAHARMEVRPGRPLAGEIADGVVFANGSLSHMAESLAVLPPEKRRDPGFFIGNRIRTCIADDEDEAKAVLRRTVTNYALMPNYRNYWKEAGYEEEMAAVERAVAAGRPDEIGRSLTDRWLADITLFGPANKVRDGVERWRDAGITTPCLVPLSADGNAETALRQVFDAFAE